MLQLFQNIIYIYYISVLWYKSVLHFLTKYTSKWCFKSIYLGFFSLMTNFLIINCFFYFHVGLPFVEITDIRKWKPFRDNINIIYFSLRSFRPRQKQIFYFGIKYISFYLITRFILFLH